MSDLKILRAAPAMKFQDLGRFGYSHLGLSQGGAIDLHAHCWANHLLANNAHAVTIEISYGNCAFLAKQDCIIAIAGAEMNAKINGRPAQNWSNHLIAKGQTLQLNYATRGTHSYLAIQHGFEAPKTLGSSSTVSRNDIGSSLTSETILFANKRNSSTFQTKTLPASYIPDYLASHKIRIILPEDQERAFGTLLLNTTFTISPHSDRMGINLISEEPLPALPGIISEGIGIGAIQLPPSGHPTVLMNDRQTQGGYAKVGTIARVDLPILSQARPETKINFIPISLQQATEEWTEFVKFFSL